MYVGIGITNARENAERLRKESGKASSVSGRMEEVLESSLQRTSIWLVQHLRGYIKNYMPIFFLFQRKKIRPNMTSNQNGLFSGRSV